ncbi:adenylate-forming reductase 06235-like [Arachis duranensis]|uniref:Adenylate-forming reductase 06235-like n=1 Tax=Arachis duranensis TaxID=130453 RepID=A0A6P4BEM9_ARADU|nr:adenylate-forming reductase 06235-like [Arachis duranensis]
MGGTEMKIARFSSCRGVPFEINANRSNPFAIEPPPTPIPKPEPTTHGSWRWLPWTRTSSFKLLPRMYAVSPGRSRSSSHFCDIDIDADKDDHDDDDDDVEVEFIAEGTQDAEKQQQKKANSSRLSIILLDQGFTVYKWIFLVCLALNMVALSLAASGHFPYAKEKASLFSIANILALTLCRSEATLRILFYLVVKTIGKPFVPLRIKTSTTSFLQSLGGIHSSCGVSSISWLLFSLVLTMKNKNKTSTEIIVVAFVILLLLFLSSLAAFPLVRHLHHNVFERTHRFAGWTALILLWLFILLSISYDPNSQSYHFTISKMIKNQESWFTLAITILIVLPWLTVRKVAVRVSTASSHATIIKFEGGVEAGLFGRISPSPLSEWHAFGIISDGKKEHMMLAGAVGDFTRSLVSTKPNHLWVRKLHFAGLTYLVKLYKRVLLVATGSGICVFLSFLLQKRQHHVDVYLIWVAKDIETNFGKEIVELVRNYPKEKVIVHDTGVCGRPNVGEMSVEGATTWNCEVVIVTSNPQGSKDVVRACKKAKIPAFGPIWDS